MFQHPVELEFELFAALSATVLYLFAGFFDCIGDRFNSGRSLSSWPALNSADRWPLLTEVDYSGSS